MVEFVEAACPVQALGDRVDGVVVGLGHPGFDLGEAPPVVVDEFTVALLQALEPESVGGEDGDVPGQVAELLERTEVVAEAVGDRPGVEADVRGDRRQDVVAGEEERVLADEGRVTEGVPGRPHRREPPGLERQGRPVLESEDRVGQVRHLQGEGVPSGLLAIAGRAVAVAGRAVAVLGRPAHLEALDLVPPLFGHPVGAGDVEVGIRAGAEVDRPGGEALDRTEVLAMDGEPHLRVGLEEGGDESDVVPVVVGDGDAVDVADGEADPRQRRGEGPELVPSVPARVDEGDAGAVGDRVAVGEDERIVRNGDRNRPDPLGDLFDGGEDAVLPTRATAGG